MSGFSDVGLASTWQKSSYRKTILASTKFLRYRRVQHIPGAEQRLYASLLRLHSMLPKLTVSFTVRSAAILCVALTLAGPFGTATLQLQAQPQKVITVGTPEMPLDGKWQFHPGDSPLSPASNTPLWADPAFDDAKWKQVEPDTLGDQNLPYSQISWYRRRVTINRQDPQQKLAILVRVANTYQVYWNGQLLGGVGKVPPRFNWPYFDTAVFSLPLSSQSSVSGVFAIRAWCQYPASVPDGCGFLDPPVIGDAALEQGRPTAHRQSILATDYLFAGTAALTLLIASIALLVYLRGRRDLLYLWFAIFLLGAAAFNTSGYAIGFGNWIDFKDALANGAMNAAFLLLVLWLFGLQDRGRLRRIVSVLALVIAIPHAIDGLLGLCWAYAGPGIQRADTVLTIFIMIFPLAPLVLLGIALCQKGARRDWPVIAAGTAFFSVSALYNISGQWPDLLHWKMDWLEDTFQVGFFYYNIILILLLLLLAALGFSVFRHFLAERRRQEHSEHELHAAREVQQVLVPEKVPSIPGYAIASVYRPASEVGGDFFQIFSLDAGGAHNDGGTLVAIGDVSGKGMKAAMIVSLIVGTLRTVASYTEQPAEILAQLNTRLHGRMSGGFVTCLILRITPDRQILAAHAGHLPPYIDGKEVTALAGSLPLGLVPGIEYEQATIVLAPDETLTLLTDGVLEAQNATHELFGFDRLDALLATHPTAEQIAETACTFGQEDDITVLTLTRMPLPHASTLSA